MNKQFIIHVLILFSLINIAQTKNYDLVVKSQKLEKIDTNRIKEMTREDYFLINKGDYNKAILAIQKTKLLSNSLNFKRGIIECYYNLGFLYFRKCYYKNAMENCAIALKMSLDINYQKSVNRLLSLMGSIYFNQGNNTKALECNLKALKLNEKIGDKKLMETLTANIGSIYSMQGNYQKALEYHLNGLKVSKEGQDSISIATSLTSIGEIYEQLNQNDRAFNYYFNALKILERTNNDFYLNKLLLNIGALSAKNNDFESGLYYFNKSLKISEAIEDKQNIVICLGNLGYIYDLKKEFNKAENVLLKSLTIAKEINDLESIKNGNEALSEFYEKQKKHIKSLFYYKQFIAVRDSINSKQDIQKQVRLEMNFDFDKKLALEKADQDKKAALQKKELEEKKYFMLASLAIALLTILTAWLLIYQNKLRTQRQKQDLEQKLLQTQMNPHFIFNALNSIQNYIYKNDSLLAGLYLSRFAELIRMILDNSRENFVSLEKEIKGLNYYLELQQLRFENKFDYRIDLDPEIDPETISIPPMLAQPFIENALEHGLLYKKEKGLLIIRFILKNNILIFEVEDNGIGLKEAKELKTNFIKTHKSLATIITNERLVILNKRKRKKIMLNIVDLKETNAHITGTKVVFDIPFVEL